jgi:AhpD family alkylhydroperoxidase
MSLRLDYQHHAAAGLKSLGAVYGVAGCGLEKTLVDLVYLRASQINGCAYCIHTHAQDLTLAGTSQEKLALLTCWRESDNWFTPREQAALAWAEAVTMVSVTHVPDAIFATAQSQFDDKQLSDLTIAIGLINAYNRLAISFRRGPAAPAPAIG